MREASKRNTTYFESKENKDIYFSEFLQNGQNFRIIWQEKISCRAMHFRFCNSHKTVSSSVCKLKKQDKLYRNIKKYKNFHVAAYIYKAFSHIIIDWVLYFSATGFSSYVDSWNNDFQLDSISCLLIFLIYFLFIYLWKVVLIVHYFNK